MANIKRLANDRLAPGDQVTRAAIQATLHEYHTGCRPGKDASPDDVGRMVGAQHECGGAWGEDPCPVVVGLLLLEVDGSSQPPLCCGSPPHALGARSSRPL